LVDGCPRFGNSHGVAVGSSTHHHADHLSREDHFAVGSLDTQSGIIDGQGHVVAAQSHSEGSQSLGHGTPDPVVEPGQDPALRFNDGDSAAEFGVGAAQLNPDVTSADQHQFLRYVIAEQQVVGADDPLAIDREVGELDRT